MNVVDVVPESAVVRCVKLLAIAVVSYVLVRLTGVHQLYPNDGEGIGALLQIIGTLYSVLYAFGTFVIWGQFTAVESEILKEAGALNDLVVFSAPLKDAVRDPIVRAVRGYVRAVVENEWEALSCNSATPNTDKLFFNIVSSVNEINAESDAHRVLYERLLEIANCASTHRAERLSLSVKRIPRTLLAFVSLTAITILVLLFIFPFHNAVLGGLSIGIASMLLFFAHFVLTDLDNPFEGAWNINSEPFAEVLSKAR